MKTAILSFVTVLLFVTASLVATTVSASPTTTFNQTINAGTLRVDIVDGSYAAVGSPSVAMSNLSFSSTCQTSTGTFGTSTQKIYVENPDAADNGWNVTIAASAPTNVWDSLGTDFDFNDGSGGTPGCTDGGDTDALAGQMTINPSVGTLATGQCAGCSITSVTKGSSSSFAEGTTNSITVLSGAAGSDDIGDWTLIGVSISQKVPGSQPAASDYSLNLTLTITAL